MAEYVGVLPWYEGDLSDELRRAAIMFDKIAFAHVHTQAECDVFSDTPGGRRTLETVEALREHGLLVACPDRSGELAALAGVDELFRKGAINDLKEKGLAGYRQGPFHARGMRFCDMYARVSAAYFSHVEQQEAMPIVRSMKAPRGMESVTRASAVSILLERIAIPTRATSLEDILAFRSDNAAFSHHRRLMNWLDDELQRPINVKRFENDLQIKLHDHAAHLANPDHSRSAR